MDRHVDGEMNGGGWKGGRIYGCTDGLKNITSEFLDFPGNKFLR